MTFKDCLLAEYVERRLDTYETRSCLYSVDYAPWARICKLVGGATEECVDVANDGDTIMEKARRLSVSSLTVREHAYLALMQRGIVFCAEAEQPGNNSCASCERDGSCTIQVRRQATQRFFAEAQSQRKDHGKCKGKAKS